MARLTLAELAARFGRSEQTVRKWRKRGAPGFAMDGGRVLGDPEALASWLKRTNACKPGPKLSPEAMLQRQEADPCAA